MRKKLQHVEKASLIEDGKGGRTLNDEEPQLPYILDEHQIAGDYEAGIPYRTSTGSVLFVTAGSTVFEVDLIEYRLGGHDCLIIPPGSVIESRERGTGYDSKLLVFDKLPEIVHRDPLSGFISEPRHLSLQEDEWHRSELALELLDRHLKAKEPAIQPAEHLLIAILSDLRNIYVKDVTDSFFASHTRQEEIFRRFIAILNEQGTVNRNILFYAERLNLSPNHLSTVIRRHSGKTVMDWVNHTVIIKSKLMLKYTDMLIKEIADALDFPDSTAFNHFFKKYAGVPPLDFKKGTRKDPA